MIVIGIDGRLKDQTGVGRYTRNLFCQLQKIKTEIGFDLFAPPVRWHSLAEQVVLLFWLLKKQYSLVHFTYFSFPVFYPGKFVLTIHDLIPWHFKTGQASTFNTLVYRLKHFFYKLVVKIGASRAAKIITPSSVTKNDIVKTLKINPDKIKVIYEGVDRKYQISNIKNQKMTQPYFLYVGNAYPHKNLELLIEAMKELDDGIKLILVGPDDFFYRRLKAKVKAKNIVFYGSVSDGQLASLYAGSLALVNPSFSEGFGLPGLEAMAVGTPVVCSSLQVFKEIYADCALYFNPEDKKDIASKLLAVLDLPSQQRDRMVKKGRDRAKDFSWRQCAKETLAVYRSLL